MSTLRGGVFADGTDDLTELRALVEDIGARSFEARIGSRGLPDPLDTTAWRHLEETGLTRLDSTTDSGGGPAEVAVILRALARHAVSVPVAETDLLACWLAVEAGLDIPDSGPLTVAFGGPVPYGSECAAVILAVPDGQDLRVAVCEPADLSITKGHNAGGERRDAVEVAGAAVAWTILEGAAAELTRRGAWARCVQMVGALDAAVEFSVAHTRDREQFGRPLSAFQSVQHTLAGMAGEVERARAAANLAVAAVAEHGFASAQADYAVTVAKVTFGQVVPHVVGAAHQLHGAIGVTIEHRLWLVTQRARCWLGEFGDTATYARRLGRMGLAADDPWGFLVG